MGRPILVTGSHRSGTTWAGRMLCQSKQTGYIHEPFNPNRSPGWLPEPLPYWFMYICEENEDAYAAAVERIIAMRYPAYGALRRSRSLKQVARQLGELQQSVRYRMSGLRPLVKDPLAVFSAEWLARRFDMQVVVMIRHPAAVVSSMKRLNWGFDYERNWLAQDLLMRDQLGRFSDDFVGYEGEVDIVGEGIVVWNAIYEVVARYMERHPDWLFVKYEQLAEEPALGFQELYKRLGLRWDEKVAERIQAYAGTGNPKEVAPWRRRTVKRDSRAAKDVWMDRLTQEEIDRIRSGVAKVSANLYDDADWEMAVERAG